MWLLSSEIRNQKLLSLELEACGEGGWEGGGGLWGAVSRGVGATAPESLGSSVVAMTGETRRTVVSRS